MPDKTPGPIQHNLLSGSGTMPLGAIMNPQPMQPAVPPGVVMKKPPNAVMPLPPAPATNSLEAGNSGWTALGNTQAGDCVIACAGHVIQVAAWHARRQVIAIAEDECLDVYEKLSTWRRGDTNDGPGVPVAVGFDYAKNTGLGGHKIANFYRSNFLPGNGRWKQDRNCLNQDTLRRSMSVFGSVVVAFDCPSDAADWQGSKGPWVGQNIRGGIIGGHCIPLIGYDSSWFWCITWGNVVKMDWDFLVRFTREVYVAYAEDWMTTAGSPDFNYSPAQLAETLTVDEAIEIMPVVP